MTVCCIDIEVFLKLGGTRDDASDVLGKISTAELSEQVQALSIVTGPPESTVTASEEESGNVDAQSASIPTDEPPTSMAYRISNSGAKGLGAFALRPLKRGGLILSEVELIKISSRDNGGKLDQLALASALAALSPSDRKVYFSLANGHAGTQIPHLKSPADKIFRANAISIEDDESGIFAQASRFNHSCSPNARYSWDPTIKRLRIHALREIAADEEIFVCYLASRNVYGTGTQGRQHQLTRFGFICGCVTCSLNGPDAIISDQRRTEIARIWDSVPMFLNQPEKRLREIARAIHLLQDEGYVADFDDFTNDAVAICAFHSDWDSAKYWATLTYETRVAEFGHDSRRATEVRGQFLDPKTLPMAGMGRHQRFSVRL